MNCKKGDIARIIGPTGAPNCDRIVRCIRLLHLGEEAVIDGYTFVATSHSQFWLVEGRLLGQWPDGTTQEVPGGPVGDRWLRPIRDQDGEDEMLRIAGKPQEIKTGVPA